MHSLLSKPFYYTMSLEIFDQYLNDLKEYQRKTSAVIGKAVQDGHISESLGDQLELNADMRVIRYLEIMRREIHAYINRFEGWDERLL